METVLKNLRPIARKQYRCEMCGGVINKGEEYLYSSITYGKSVYNIKVHEKCNALANELRMDDGDGYTSNDFEAAIDGYVRENHYIQGNIDQKWHLPLSELVEKAYNENFNK